MDSNLDLANLFVADAPKKNLIFSFTPSQRDKETNTKIHEHEIYGMVFAKLTVSGKVPSPVAHYFVVHKNMVKKLRYYYDLS